MYYFLPQNSSCNLYIEVEVNIKEKVESRELMVNVLFFRDERKPTYSTFSLFAFSCSQLYSHYLNLYFVNAFGIKVRKVKVVCVWNTDCE